MFEDRVYQLKGINDKLVSTMGRTYLDIQLDDRIITTEFQVVHADFPVPHDGILGTPFMITNGIIINYQTNEVIIPNELEIVLQPRAENLVVVPAKNHVENEHILIEN